jgi:amino acid transporter, AAT family
MLPILIICGIIPWNQVSSDESPFVQVFSIAGIPGAADVMNFVLITAVLSAANSGIYATSRTLFSMAQNGEAPKSLGKTSKKGIPVNGITLTTIFILLGVFLAYMIPNEVIGYLMAIPGMTVILIWLSICLAQLKLRRLYKKTPNFKVLWFPFTTIMAIIVLIIIFFAFLFNSNNIIGTIVCVVTVSTLTILSYFFRKK